MRAESLRIASESAKVNTAPPRTPNDSARKETPPPTTSPSQLWRNMPQSQRSGSELDDSTGTLIVVRALNRVSWRNCGDPHRVVVFDIDNQTGIDSMSVVARAYADALRAAVRRSGAEVAGDSAARATRETNNRRFVGLEWCCASRMARCLPCCSASAPTSAG